MESRLRRGATFCRLVAAVAGVLGFAGSMAVGSAFERGSGDGLTPGALLALLLVSVLAVLLFVFLFLMLARMMAGLAELAAHTERQDEAPAAFEAARREVPVGHAGEEPGAGRAGPSEREHAPARTVSLEGAMETIGMGPWVKVATAGGWIGWVRDAELRPDSAPLPVTAAGLPYRRLLPSLSADRESRGHLSPHGQAPGAYAPWVAG